MRQYKTQQNHVRHNKDPSTQLQNTGKATEFNLKKQLDEMKGFKFVEILRMVFNKFDGDVTTAYFKSKTKTVINENDINLDLLDSSQEIKNKILVGYLKVPVGLLIQSIIIISTLLNTTPQKDRHLKIPSELRNFTKGLINLKNEDDQCFRCCHIRHLNAQGSVTLKTPAYVGMCILDLS